MITIKSILSIPLLVLSCGAVCQNPLFFKNYTLDEGLSQNSITSICQDNYGYIWLGTNDGLNKFDGYAFKIYRNDPSDSTSLTNNAVFCMLVDHNGDLWIGTRGGGLNKYQKDQDNFRYFDLNLSVNVIRYLFEDSDSNLWVGTNGGLILLKPETGTYIRFDHNEFDPYSLADNMVNAIAEDRNGALWIGTRDKGLERFDRETGTFQHYGVREPGALIPVYHISALFIDEDGYMWIGTQDAGLSRYHLQSGKFKQYPVNTGPFTSTGINTGHIINILPDGNENLWIATFGGGISYFNKLNNRFSHYYHIEQQEGTLSKNAVLSMFIDKWQNLWIGTEGGGLNFADKNRKKFYTYSNISGNPNSLSYNSVLCVKEAASSEFWIGTDNSGLYYFDKDKRISKYYKNHPETPNSLSQDVITALIKDSYGQLWVGTASSGLNRLNEITGTFHIFTHDPDDAETLSHNNIVAIFEDSKKGFWIGTNGGGLNLFDRKNLTSIRFLHNETDLNSISNNFITCIIEDRDNNLWIGTWEGLNRFIDETSGFKTYLQNKNNPSSINNNAITHIFIDSSGTIWIGTYSGLNKYVKESDSFISYDEKSGLPNKVICGILEDEKNNLWISTYHGISRFDPLSETFRNYFAIDGLQGNQFNVGACSGSQTGEMIFGGINGFTIFHPDSIRDNPFTPSVQITDFKLFNQKVKINTCGSPLEKTIWETREINLKHYQSAFTFQFVAINYTATQNCRYKFMLENFDNDWIDNGTSQIANYTNVPPGKYIFRVIASNNDGIWNDEGTSLEIYIQPPFWQTWWFRILVGMLIISLTVMIPLLRLRAIKKQKKVLEHQVKERTREVVAQKNEIEQQAESLRVANREIIEKNVALSFQKEEIENQAAEIRRMNVLLRSRNINLTRDVKEKSRDLVMQKQVSFEEFREIYPDDEACLILIKELKSGEPFICPSCHHTDFYTMEGHYFRRCKNCGNKESITSNTIFHRLKFPVVKAFYILYLVSTGRDLTVDELSQLIHLRRETCWAFRNKVMNIMQTRKRFKNPREGWKELILIPAKHYKKQVKADN